ncbi:ficolin-2-like [Crassostrea angulata]|uniref:ficolin-2-like n=1 Tax=Magallana angulata TaxID=2784310 RepID=UPI0022B1668A|nr:ficolin-2-like [Crassostrea angulata]
MKSVFENLIIFQIKMLTVQLTASCDSYYSAIPEVENKIGTSYLVQKAKASSLSFCGSLCINNCNCFGYNRLQKQCRLHVICDVGNMSDTGAGWRYYRVSRKAEDCLALYQAGHTCSGVYTLHPAGGANTDVVCDMETMGGGWTVIQNRFDGSENFNRNWADYKNGFGLAVGEYWIGNDAIHNLTQANNSLYISITLTNGTTLYELYELFRISNEQDNYRLSIGGTAAGTLGNRMTPNSATDNLNGREFSTSEGSNSCAQNHKGGWWYNGCYDAYLNGLFGSSDWVQPWYPLLTTGKSIQKTAMMIRRG